MEIAIEEEKGIKAFESVLRLLKTVNEEQTLTLTKEGIATKTMDPSHVAMVDLKVKAAAFTRYEVPEVDEKTPDLKLSFNLKELLDRISAIEEGERVRLEYDAREPRLLIHATRPSQGRKRRFGINLMEPTEEDVPSPKIGFASEARLILSEPARAIKDGQMVAEHIVIKISENRVAFEAKGEKGDASLTLEKGAEGLLSLKSTEESHATYVLSYLADMIGAAKDLAEVLTIYLTTDMPLRISLEAPNLECDLYLAPCIGS